MEGETMAGTDWDEVRASVARVGDWLDRAGGALAMATDDLVRLRDRLDGADDQDCGYLAVAYGNLANLGPDVEALRDSVASIAGEFDPAR